jgi:UDP-N-acetylglucosamine:LPS N-acetylglucosamine transferase
MKIALICSHGGHLTETMQILSAFNGHELFFVTYRSARDADVEKLARAYFTENIGLNPWRMLKTFFWAWHILRRERPDVLFSLGAEIAVPFFCVGKFYGIRTIYIESWCRVKTLSLTGRLLYPFVDEFWVQWEDLLARCGPRARYHGAVL